MGLLDRANRLAAALELVSAARGAARMAYPRPVAEQPGIGGRYRAVSQPQHLAAALYAGFMLVFFSISTNQEYYTFPAYLPLLILTAAVLASFELRAERVDKEAREGTDGWLLGAHLLFAVVGVVSASALSYGLWTSRRLAFVPDIGTLLAHRGVGDYSLSMSHLFDLTGPSFAALRLPAAIAAVVLLVGPVLALQMRRKARHFEATLSVAFTMAIFLIAAHIAFVRFAPMLSSEPMAATINRIAGYPTSESSSDPAAMRATLIVYGDQSDAASVLFYTRRHALLVHGRSSTMVWGSMWPDAPHIFIDDKELASIWGTGNRKFLFAQAERRDQVEAVLGKRLIPIQELADKTLYTDRPLYSPLAQSTCSCNWLPNYGYSQRECEMPKNLQPRTFQFVEGPAFSQDYREDYLDDEAFAELSTKSCHQPRERANTDPGCRWPISKVRWKDSRRRKGKRGGLRGHLLLLPCQKKRYGSSRCMDKNEAIDLTKEQRDQLRRALEEERAARKNGESKKMTQNRRRSNGNAFAEIMEGIEAMKGYQRHGKVTLRTQQVPCGGSKGINRMGDTLSLFTREIQCLPLCLGEHVTGQSAVRVEKWEQGGQVSPLAATLCGTCRAISRHH